MKLQSQAYLTDKIKIMQGRHRIRPRQSGASLDVRIPLLTQNLFPEHKHLVLLAPVLFHLFRNGGAVVMLVPELDDMAAAALVLLRIYQYICI